MLRLLTSSHMDLKLVYRILRQISRWTVDGFYDDVLVEGQHFVPAEGPTIIAATHHNEMIDIATLAVTIPHERHVSFWAKASMFKSAVGGAILRSSGTIPVTRSPDHAPVMLHPHGTPDATTATDIAPSSRALNSTSRAGLFAETSRVLTAGGVVGVFPEGTSYTRENIAQLMPGAAWAAVEYMRYAREGRQKARGDRRGKGADLMIVPMSIVYTDKSRFRSRIYVRYGTPISVGAYEEELFADGMDTDDASRAVVKKIMDQVGKQLRDMSINAPDWDTLCAVKAASCILWGNEDRMPLEHYVEISQRLIAKLAEPTSEDAKAALVKYSAFLYYTGIKHDILASLTTKTATTGRGTMLAYALASLLLSLPSALIRLALFLPPLLLYIPAYGTGKLMVAALAHPREQESHAQFKALGGGVGLGAVIALLGCVVARTGVFYGRDMREGLGMACVSYFGIYVVMKWHNLLMSRNYKALQRLITFGKLLLGLAFVRPDGLPVALRDACSRRPPPPVNIFIQRREGDSEAGRSRRTPELTPQVSLGSRLRLVGELLDARWAAQEALERLVAGVEERAWLGRMGACE